MNILGQDFTFSSDTDPSLPLYVVEDEDGNDLLGCDQEGVAAARLAARTLVQEGHAVARVRAVDERFAFDTFRLDERGNVSVATSYLGRDRA